MAAETISPFPPCMPLKHQQERLTLEINMCCWNAFRYHSRTATLQGKDLPHRLPRGAEQRLQCLFEYTGVLLWGNGRLDRDFTLLGRG